MLYLASARASIMFAPKEMKRGEIPLSKLRRKLQFPARLAARMLLMACGVHKVKVRGTDQFIRKFLKNSYNHPKENRQLMKPR